MSIELFLATLLLFIITATTSLYYKRIKKVSKSYVEAKEIISDILISLNRQLQTQEDKLNSLALKVASFSSRVEDVVKKYTKRERTDKHLKNLEGEVKNLSEVAEKLSKQVSEISEALNKVMSQQRDVMRKITEIDKLKEKVTSPEVVIKTAIPIRREKALAHLTETELLVLEILSAEGEKTVPEIRERIKLTREHTARLMKKLYEEGYLERDVSKMPYTYRIKDEMKKILVSKKKES